MRARAAGPADRLVMQRFLPATPPPGNALMSINQTDARGNSLANGSAFVSQ